jgi:hypothetical protein
MSIEACKAELGPYTIVDDDSGHSYVIPVSKKKAWSAWIGSADWDDGDVPDWAAAIGGAIELVEFGAFTIE